MASLQRSTFLMFPSSPAKLLPYGQGLFRRQGMNAVWEILFQTEAIHQSIVVASLLRYAHRRRGLSRLYKQFRQILADYGQQKNQWGRVE